MQVPLARRIPIRVYVRSPLVRRRNGAEYVAAADLVSPETATVESVIEKFLHHDSPQRN